MEIKAGQNFITLSTFTFPRMDKDGKIAGESGLGKGKVMTITAVNGNVVEFLFEGIDTMYIDINTLKSMVGDCIKEYEPKKVTAPSAKGGGEGSNTGKIVLAVAIIAGLATAGYFLLKK